MKKTLQSVKAFAQLIWNFLLFKRQVPSVSVPRTLVYGDVVVTSNGGDVASKEGTVESPIPVKDFVDNADDMGETIKEMVVQVQELSKLPPAAQIEAGFALEEHQIQGIINNWNANPVGSLAHALGITQAEYSLFCQGKGLFEIVALRKNK